MPTLTLILPKPHAGQVRLLREASRFNVVDCGRRFGKSVISRERLVRVALDGAPVAYFCPTYKMLSDYWRESISTLRPVIRRVNVQEKRIELITGGVWDFWSLDAFDTVRGRKYKRVAIDEAAMVPNLTEAWQQVIRPTLTDFRGDADFYSTPKGRNFFWECFQRGQDPAQPDWMSWKMPTLTNPYIAPSEVEAARNELPERVFQQEYLAEFLDDAGGVFRRVAESATAREQKKAVEGHQYVMGVDWGRSGDFSVFDVIDVNTGEQVAMERFTQIEYATQIARLIALYERFRPDGIVAEENSIGRPIIEQLWAKNLPVIPFQTTNATKQVAIDGLTLAFERGELKIINDPVQVNELQSYQMERLPSGLLRYSAPEGQHDDTVMALALAWWGASKCKGMTVY